MAKSNNEEDPNDINSIGKNIGTFLLSIVILTIIVCIHIMTGGLLMYCCKLAQSNIIPTEIKCEPYGDTKPDIKSVIANIFVSQPPKSDEKLSQKIKFLYEGANTKNMLLDLFKKVRESNNTFFLVNYLLSMVEDVVCLNYSSMNFFLNLMNQNLSETMILILGPFIAYFFTFFMLFIDNIYLIYLWFAKMVWFFRYNENPDDTGKPRWKSVTMLQPFSYFFAMFLIFVFFILLFVVGLVSFPFISFFSLAWCGFSLLGFKGVMNDQTVDISNILKKVFKYHKVTIMSILSFLVVLSAFSNVGGIAGIICIVAILLMVFDVVPSNIYKKNYPSDLTTLVSYAQASKTCKPFTKPQKHHSFLYNLIFPQSGGKKLVEEIKNIGKKLKSG